MISLILQALIVIYLSGVTIAFIYGAAALQIVLIVDNKIFISFTEAFRLLSKEPLNGFLLSWYGAYNLKVSSKEMLRKFRKESQKKQEQ